MLGPGREDDQGAAPTARGASVRRSVGPHPGRLLRFGEVGQHSLRCSAAGVIAGAADAFEQDITEDSDPLSRGPRW